MSQILKSIFPVITLLVMMARPAFAADGDAAADDPALQKALVAVQAQQKDKPAPPASMTTVTTTNKCGEIGSMDRMLMKQRKLAFLATSIDKAEAVHIYFINHSTGAWAEMIMDDNMNACIVNEGTDWHFIVGD